MDIIRWGMIGCGDVTEVKSGPAFSKVPSSELIAVMSRNAERAEDYARRHNIGSFYSDAELMISNPLINAVYIATPPSSHLQYCIAALKAGKAVYVEKPMTLNASEASALVHAIENFNGKLCLAHYRRAQPKFLKIRDLIFSGSLGKISEVNISFGRKPLSAEELHVPKTAWRVDPKISGGGLFHDLAPHQLDLLLYFFGEGKVVSAFTANTTGQYNAPDIVITEMKFNNDINFNGSWDFNAAEDEDLFAVTGSEDGIRFSSFGTNEIMFLNDPGASLNFPTLQHVQQPMIEKVVGYFLGREPNPCSAADGLRSMQWIDGICSFH